MLLLLLHSPTSEWQSGLDAGCGPATTLPLPPPELTLKTALHGVV